MMPILAQPINLQPFTRGETQSLCLAYHRLLAANRTFGLEEFCAHEKFIPRKELRALGVDDDILMWMLYQAHLVHVSGEFIPMDAAGKSPPLCSVRVGETSQVALTRDGAAFAEVFLRHTENADDDAAAGVVGLGRGQFTPHYEPVARIFRWGRHLLKQFRQKANNQEIILSAAQELNWAEWFDDPLPPRTGDAKKRLQDTIRDLNKRQIVYLVHFKGNGTGRAVGWELR